MRTGDEPSHARSPLRLRLALTVFGMVSALVGTVLLAEAGRTGWAIAFGALVVLTVADLGVVIRRIRQGPHYQPGPQTPPYRPVDPVPRPVDGAGGRGRPAQPVQVPVRTRVHRYLIIMGVCVTLLLIGWIWVARFSTTAAVVITIVAMALPPIAAIIANTGWRAGSGPDGR